MAINKSQSPMWVKVVLIILIIAFVAMFTVGGTAGLFGGSIQADRPADTGRPDAADQRAVPAAGRLAVRRRGEPAHELHGAGEPGQHVHGLGRRAAAGEPERHRSGDAVPRRAQRLREGRRRSRRTTPRCSATTRSCCTTPATRRAPVTAANDAVALKPDFAVVWFNLGNFYLQQAKTGTAGPRRRLSRRTTSTCSSSQPAIAPPRRRSNIAEAQKLP